ncbi:hypothetical protein HHI36_006668, partial [Cryptolaemus montrouzieri]
MTTVQNLIMFVLKYKTHHIVNCVQVKFYPAKMFTLPIHSWCSKIGTFFSSLNVVYSPRISRNSVLRGTTNSPKLEQKRVKGGNQFRPIKNRICLYCQNLDAKFLLFL